MTLDEHRTLPISPQRGSQKRKTADFHQKLHFVWRRSATKFLYLKNVSDKTVWYLLAYLPVQKWLVRDMRENSAETDSPLAKCRFFLSIFARSASAVTPTCSKKVQLTLIGSPLRSLQWTSYVVPKPPKGGLKNAKRPFSV